jgi:hypothetical protein
MLTSTRRANPGAAAQIRRYYDKQRLIVPGARARRDVLTLLDDRKALQRAGEALMTAALPYAGDPSLKAAIDGFRAVLEGAHPE